MTEVKLDGVLPQMVTPIPEFKENVVRNKALGLRRIHELPEFRALRPIAVVGGGPSLVDHLDELRKFRVIIAAGSVHDYLMEQGIIPTYCVVTDADSIMNNYMTKPSRDTTYLIASHCSPSTFDKLAAAGVHVVTFHCGGDPAFNDEYFGEGEFVMGGGCTVGSRAFMIAYTFGYLNIHLFGMDSCLQGEKHHSYESSDPEKEKLDNIVDIRIGDATFKVAGYMLAQLFDVKDFVQRVGNAVTLTVHGDGALKALMATKKEKKDG